MSLNIIANHNELPFYFIPLFFLSLATVSAFILTSGIVLADNDSVVDQINITVPVSCTMTGTGMDSHSTEIQNGIYKDNIGTTTLHAFCNDNEGFAIYAAGYTGNEIGGTNSNKLVGTTASSNATIVSGIATTAGSPDISNWAMKLAISQDSGDTISTNAFTIDSAPNVDLPSEAEQSATQASFSEYHVVPNEYVKVAHKNSMTDMTASTGGVKLTTTYAAYISKTQAADTYTGQVIYTLVHPASADVPRLEQVSVVFDGNGLLFPNGSSTNTVKYAKRCSSDIYVSNSYQEAMTSNITSGGEQTGGAYTDSENVLLSQTFAGASKILVAVNYGFTGDTTELLVINDSWDGDWDNYDEKWNDDWIYDDGDISGTKEYILDGDTVTVFGDSWGVPVSGYDYGFYARIYPAYDTERPNTTKVQLPNEVCSVMPISGTYMETATWNDKWVPKVLFNEEEGVSFESESELISYISDNYESMNGTTFDVSAYNPTTVVKRFDVTYDTSDENKLFFDEEMTQTQNIVNYSATCQVGSRNYDVVKTSNLSNDGTKITPFSGQSFEIVKQYQGNVKKIKITVRYGFAADGGYINILDGYGQLYGISSETDNMAGSEIFVLETIGDAITINVDLWGAVEGYDYGAYIIIQALDENDNVISISDYSNCSYETVGGTYLQPDYPIFPYWFDGWHYQRNVLFNEQDLIEAILEHSGPVDTTLYAAPAV